MKNHRDTLIETAASDAGLPSPFAKLLIADAPWLDGTKEVNGELGPDLLAQEASAFNLCTRKIDEFIERYNTLVQVTNNPHAVRQSEAYVVIAQVLIPFGKENGYGEGDFWLVEDSFSTRTPVILVYDDYRFPQAAITRLQEILNKYRNVFSEIRVNTEYGAQVLTLQPQ